MSCEPPGSGHGAHASSRSALSTARWSLLCLARARALYILWTLIGTDAAMAGDWFSGGSSFIPHGYCLAWDPMLVSAEVGADAQIGRASCRARVCQYV